MNKSGRNFARSLPVTLALIGIVLSGAPREVSAQENQEAGQRVQDRGPEDPRNGHGKVEMLHVQGNVYMISGAGANVTVQVGNQFVIVVDPGLAQMSDEVLAAIRSLTDKHILS
jgi:hypothetical protein